jgi:hypothetical protein
MCHRGPALATVPVVIHESDALQFVLAHRASAAGAAGRRCVTPRGWRSPRRSLAGEDVPPFANSAVDGYAVRAADVGPLPPSSNSSWSARSLPGSHTTRHLAARRGDAGS